MRNPRYSIGDKYITRGRRKDVCTIIDIHTTTNASDEVVKITYVATHDFLGQIVTNYEVYETTISMGLLSIGHE
jgi:hypothetical protein